MAKLHPQIFLRSHFFKQLGYTEIRITNNNKQLEIVLEKEHSGIIELIIPKQNAVKEREFLSKNGPHPYQVAIYESSFKELSDNLKKMNFEYNLTCAEDEDNPDTLSTTFAKYHIFYRKEKKEAYSLEKRWQIHSENPGKLIHKNQLLPLQNHTAKMLLRLPTYKTDESLLSRVDMEEPRHRTDKKLMEIWQHVLNVDEIGINVSFFESGGNSLKAVILVSEIHKEFNAAFELSDIFKTKTIKALSDLILNSGQTIYAPVKAVEKKDYYPLSPAQDRIFIQQRMELTSTAYNLFQSVELKEKPRRKKLAHTFEKLIEKHESLITSFDIIAGKPVQKIHDDVDFSIEYYEVDEEEAGKIRGSFKKPFDLGKAPLLRVGLLTVEKQKYILTVDMHHIISDGVSLILLLKDFMALYRGEELSPLRLHYKDYAVWQNQNTQKEAIKKQEEYWLQEFAGDIPLLNIPGDYDRPAIKSSAGKGFRFVLGKEETTALRTTALHEGGTLYMILLALYSIFLAKIGSREDIVIGTPTAGRRHADLRQIIGMFVNTLAIRSYPGEDKTFNEFFKEVRETTLNAFENQDYPFEELVENVMVERDPARSPIFDVFFVLHNQADLAQDTPEFENLLSYETESKFDLALRAVETGENLLLNLIYSTRLFQAGTIEKYIHYFKEIVSAVLKNKNIKIGDIEISHRFFAGELALPGEEGDFAF